MTGEITKAILSAMFVTFLVGTFILGANAQIEATGSANTSEFYLYGEMNNRTGDFIAAGTVDYEDTNNTIDSSTTIANQMFTEIADAQSAYAQGDPASLLAAAFGLMQTLIIVLLQVLLGAAIQSINLVGGIALNLMLLPPPWREISVLGGFAVSLMIVWWALQLAHAAKTGENI